MRHLQTFVAIYRLAAEQLTLRFIFSLSGCYSRKENYIES